MPELDLSVASLMRACKGDATKLPRFLVHDNEVWRPGVVLTDNKGRINLRRATFYQVVAGKIPVKPGLWLRVDAQEFLIDLRPDHLQGGHDTRGGSQQNAARLMALIDSAGRAQHEDGHGEDNPRDYRAADIASDVRAAKEAGTSGSVRSFTLSTHDTERGLLGLDD